MTEQIVEMQILKLQKDITDSENRIRDRLQKGREVKDSAYSVLAFNYNKLFKVSKENENAFDSSIENINKAIELSPYRLHHYATRADFYLQSGKYDLAKEDIDRLRDKTSVLQGIEKIYCNKIIEFFDSY